MSCQDKFHGLEKQDISYDVESETLKQESAPETQAWDEVRSKLTVR